MLRCILVGLISDLNKCCRGNIELGLLRKFDEKIITFDNYATTGVFQGSCRV